MPGERQLFLWSKNAHANSALGLGFAVSRKNERRLRKIHLPRQGLHFSIAQSVRVGEHGELVSLQPTIGEDIHLDECELAQFCSLLTCHGIPSSPIQLFR